MHHLGIQVDNRTDVHQRLGTFHFSSRQPRKGVGFAENAAKTPSGLQNRQKRHAQQSVGSSHPAVRLWPVVIQA